MKKSLNYKNICGSITRTAGQNLMTAITGCEQEVGIPTCRYNQAIAIMKKALKADELNLLCRGFGIGDGFERQSQKEIALELSVEPGEISRIMHEIIGKLQASPYKSQLRALVPSTNELQRALTLYDRGETNTGEMKALRYKFESAQKEINQLKEDLKVTEKCKSAVQRELNGVYKKLEEKEAHDKVQAKKIVELEGELLHAQKRSEAVKKAFDESISEFEEIARGKFIAKLDDFEVSVGTLEMLDLPDQALEALERVGIHDVSTLCNMTSGALNRLGVGMTNLRNIKRGLEANGLSLKVS